MGKIAKIDPKFKQQISAEPGAEKIALCFQCGTCTADCAVARFSDFYKPRKIARMVQLGLKDRLLSSSDLWLCTTCFTCIDHCPQGVEIANIVRTLRNLSVKEKGSLPLAYKTFVTSLLRTGFVYAIPDSKIRKRMELGLPPLPKSNLESIARLIKVAGCVEMLEVKSPEEHKDGASQ